MSYFYLIIVIILMSLQSVFVKEYNAKTKIPSTFAFNFFTVMASLLFFVATSGFKLNFNFDIVIYSFLFAITYTSATVGAFYALKYGPMAITILIGSYSLIVPTLYGLIVLDEKIGFFGITGILLLLVSLILVNKKKEDSKINIKWIISMLFYFFGNGLCSTVQKIQQLDFDGGYKSEFMIVALAIAGFIMLAVALIKKESFSGMKNLLCYGLFRGLANGAVNYLVMVLTGMMATAILFPSISSGGLVLGFFIALFVYKEKLPKVQVIGYVMGIMSIILLNM